jgi:hypothetical protein
VTPAGGGRYVVKMAVFAKVMLGVNNFSPGPGGKSMYHPAELVVPERVVLLVKEE